MGGGGGGETSSLFNSLNHYEDEGISEIYLNIENPRNSEFKHFINKKQIIGKNNLTDWNTLIEYSNSINSVYESVRQYKLTKKQ